MFHRVSAGYIACKRSLLGRSLTRHHPVRGTAVPQRFPEYVIHERRYLSAIRWFGRLVKMLCAGCNATRPQTVAVEEGKEQKMVHVAILPNETS